MTGETLTSSEYIKHHLQNLTFGRLPDGAWGVAAISALWGADDPARAAALFVEAIAA